jgi:hypothetical protein
VAGHCEHGNGPSGFIKYGAFLDSAPWSRLVGVREQKFTEDSMAHEFWCTLFHFTLLYQHLVTNQWNSFHSIPDDR